MLPAVGARDIPYSVDDQADKLKGIYERLVTEGCPGEDRMRRSDAMFKESEEKMCGGRPASVQAAHWRIDNRTNEILGKWQRDVEGLELNRKIDRVLEGTESPVLDEHRLQMEIQRDKI